jgi:hypothetical protein
MEACRITQAFNRASLLAKPRAMSQQALVLAKIPVTSLHHGFGK